MDVNSEPFVPQKKETCSVENERGRGGWRGGKGRGGGRGNQSAKKEEGEASEKGGRGRGRGRGKGRGRGGTSYRNTAKPDKNSDSPRGRGRNDRGRGRGRGRNYQSKSNEVEEEENDEVKKESRGPSKRQERRMQKDMCVESKKVIEKTVPKVPRERVAPSQAPIRTISADINSLELFHDERFTKNSDTPLAFTIQIEPEDPDWDELGVPIDSITVKFTIPEEGFPVEKIPKIVVDDEGLPPLLQNRVAMNLRAQCRLLKSPSSYLFNLVNWAANNLADLLLMESQEEKMKVSAERAGISFVDPNQKKSVEKTIKDIEHLKIEEEEEQEGSSEEDEEDEESDLDESADSESEGQSSEEEDVSTRAVPLDVPKLSATAMRIICDGFELKDGIGTVSCPRLSIIGRCKRCGDSIDTSLDAENESFPCPHCQNKLGAFYYPQLMHHASNVVGFLDLKGWAPVDLAPCNWIISCFECNKKRIAESISKTSSFINSSCHTCHTKQVIRLYVAVRFAKVPVQAFRKKSSLTDAEIEANKARSKVKKENSLGLVKGEPLDKNGTCKHYSKSYRWMRFPCCGRAFPCDVCHDIATGHPCERANRMICGFCSSEQQFSDKSCSYCSSNTHKSSSGTRYWEGGQGMRDVSRLDKTDQKRKRKGAGKTTSNKAKKRNDMQKGKKSRTLVKAKAAES